MLKRLACPFADRGDIKEIMDDRDALRSHPGAPGEIGGNALCVGNDGIGVRVGPADQGAQQWPPSSLAVAG
jgi:hypothetical protein